MTVHGSLPRGISRRALIAAALLASAAPASATGAAPRIVSLDWALTATLLALDLVPIGIAEAGSYRHWVGEPSPPASAVDVGLRTSPNLELVASLKPDLILMTSLSEDLRGRLERIAPVRVSTIFDGQNPPLANAEATMRDLAALSGRSATAERILSEAETTYIRLAQQISPVDKPLLLMGFLDARHVRIYGRTSLFGNVLDKLALTNAWADPVNAWGFTLVGLERLAAQRHARAVIVDPVPGEARLAMARDGLWHQLGFDQPGHAIELPPSWAFGDVTAAERFARLLAAAPGLTR